jgi:hypothetical protein
LVYESVKPGAGGSVTLISARIAWPVETPRFWDDGNSSQSRHCGFGTANDRSGSISDAGAISRFTART